MPTPEDLLQGTTGNTESVTSDTESSASVSISQGITSVIFLHFSMYNFYFISQGITSVIFLKILLLLYFPRYYFCCISLSIISFVI